MKEHYLLQNRDDPSRWLSIYCEGLWFITDIALDYGWEGWDGSADREFFQYMGDVWEVPEETAVAMADTLEGVLAQRGSSTLTLKVTADALSPFSPFTCVEIISRLKESVAEARESLEDSIYPDIEEFITLCRAGALYIRD